MTLRILTRQLFGSVAVFGMLLAVNGAAYGENWPQFRGPAASGVVTQSQLPTSWGPENNIAWKVELPGAGWSQPVVWGDRIYVTSAVTENQTKPAVGGRGGSGRGGFGGGRPPEGGQRPARERDADADAPRPRSERADENSPAGGERQDGERRGTRGPGGAGRGGYGRSAEPPDQTYRWVLYCLDRDSGKVLWEQVAHEGRPAIPTHRTNTYASETPIVDGERIIAYFGMTGLYCYDLDGKLLWKKELWRFPMSNGWGTGSSPALDGDRLFVQCDNEETSFLVALDKRTGEELWRVEREEKSNWATPYVWKNKHRTELVTAGGTMRSYDPATGKLLWELSGLNGRCSASPVGSAELLYVGVGGGRGAGPLVAIRADAEGQLNLLAKDANPGIAWSTPRAGPPMASPLVYGGAVYVLEQRGGIIGCYDAATGEVRYHKRIEGASGFTASPWAYDGKIYCLDETGQTFVIAPGPELDVVATNKLDDQFWSSAAIAGDRLLLRGVKSLYSISP